MQALDVQAKVANASLPGRLEGAMGDGYAGAWFENGLAQLYVGMTSRAGQAAAEAVVAQAGLAGVVTIVPVRSTMAQLFAAQNQWNGKLADLVARGAVQTGIQPQYQRGVCSVGLGGVRVAARRLETRSRRCRCKRRGECSRQPWRYSHKGGRRVQQIHERHCQLQPVDHSRSRYRKT
jgi:hypothetical protein